MAVKLRHPEKLFIGGEWVESLDGTPLVVVSPDTEEVVYKVAGAGPRDMDRAVESARDAFDNGPWADTSPEERIAAVERLADALDRRFVQGALPGRLFRLFERSHGVERAPSLGGGLTGVS